MSVVVLQAMCRVPVGEVATVAQQLGVLSMIDLEWEQPMSSLFSVVSAAQTSESLSFAHERNKKSAGQLLPGRWLLLLLLLCQVSVGLLVSLAIPHHAHYVCERSIACMFVRRALLE
eukprot:5361093-Amphidinium_carterae.1